MLFSCFSRCGFLRFANVLPAPQRQYQALSAQLATAFDVTPGLPASEDNEAEMFANAYNLARAEVTLEKAGYQQNVSLVSDLIGLQEESFLATPLPTDTLYQRQQRLVALSALNQGATQSNISSVLLAVLGTSFVKLRVLSLSAGEAVANLPTSNFQPLTLEGKWLQLTSPIGITGARWASYGNLDPTIPLAALNPLAVGDAVTVQTECSAVAEVVTVTSVQTTAQGVPQFLATFANAHDTGATLLTSCIPRWTSSQAILIIEVTAAASINPNIRALVDSTMQKLTRGTCQWATVNAATQTTAGVNYLGPFQVGVTPVGTATVGQVQA